MMHGNLAGFDASTIDPQTSFDPLPAGWYTVVITGSEMKATKNGDGQYLQLELTVLDGEHEGRKVWDRINLQNTNQTAVEIGQRTLSAICRAVGVMAPRDSTELHDLPMEVKLTVRPPKDQYEASNDCRGYRAAGSAGAAPSTGPRAVQGAAPAAKASTPPWKKSA